MAAHRAQVSPVLWAVAAAIWLYVVIRAVVVPFTVDESVSYFFAHGAPGATDSANNQWLNTFLMSVSEVVGQQTWVLRLPNVLSFSIYAGAWLFFVARLERTPAKVLAVVGCFGDAFLLEFFALARGYGLSLAFASLALVVLLVGKPPSTQARALLRLAMVGAAGLLAFYANFSALNLVGTVVGVGLVDIAIAHRAGRVRFSRGGLLGLAALGFAWVAILTPGLIRLRHLQDIGQLYYGATSGLVHDTIGTLAQTWGYVYRSTYFSHSRLLIPVDRWALATAWVIGGLAVIAVLIAAWRGLRMRHWKRGQRAASILVISLSGPLVEHRLTGVLFPIDRTALIYLLSFTALFALAADDLTARLTRPVNFAVGALTVALACGATVNLVRSVNFTSALTWQFDASASDVIDFMRSLEGHSARPRPLKLIAPAPRGFALNYYAVRFGLSWLRIVSAPDSTPGGDVYEVPVQERRTVVRGTRLIAVLGADGTEIRVAQRAPSTR